MLYIEISALHTSIFVYTWLQDFICFKVTLVSISLPLKKVAVFHLKLRVFVDNI